MILNVFFKPLTGTISQVCFCQRMGSYRLECFLYLSSHCHSTPASSFPLVYQKKSSSVGVLKVGIWHFDYYPSGREAFLQCTIVMVDRVHFRLVLGDGPFGCFIGVWCRGFYQGPRQKRQVLFCFDVQKVIGARAKGIYGMLQNGSSVLFTGGTHALWRHCSQGQKQPCPSYFGEQEEKHSMRVRKKEDAQEKRWQEVFLVDIRWNIGLPFLGRGLCAGIPQERKGERACMISHYDPVLTGAPHQPELRMFNSRHGF